MYKKILEVEKKNVLIDFCQFMRDLIETKLYFFVL